MRGWKRRPRVLAVDMPIGIASRERRECDALARRLLGRRASTVFPVPVRAALGATSYDLARRAMLGACGRSLSIQTFGILAKVRELDAALTPKDDWVREVHPELSFLAWAGEALPPKKSRPGRERRLELVERRWPGALLRVRASVGREAGDDDILDAFATLWTAERVVARQARMLPDPAPRDVRGLRMSITF